MEEHRPLFQLDPTEAEATSRWWIRSSRFFAGEPVDSPLRRKRARSPSPTSPADRSPPLPRSSTEPHRSPTKPHRSPTEPHRSPIEPHRSPTEPHRSPLHTAPHTLDRATVQAMIDLMEERSRAEMTRLIREQEERRHREDRRLRLDIGEMFSTWYERQYQLCQQMHVLADYVRRDVGPIPGWTGLRMAHPSVLKTHRPRPATSTSSPRSATSTPPTRFATSPPPTRFVTSPPPPPPSFATSPLPRPPPSSGATSTPPTPLSFATSPLPRPPPSSSVTSTPPTCGVTSPPPRPPPSSGATSTPPTCGVTSPAPPPPPSSGATSTPPTCGVTSPPPLPLPSTDFSDLSPLVELGTSAGSSPGEPETPPLSRGHRIIRQNLAILGTPYTGLPPTTPLPIRPGVIRPISPIPLAIVDPDPGSSILQLYRETTKETFSPLRITYLADFDCDRDWWGSLLGFDHSGYLDDEHIMAWMRHLSEVDGLPVDARWGFVHPRFSGEAFVHSDSMLRYCTQYADGRHHFPAWWDVDRLLIPWYLDQHWFAIVLDLTTWVITRYDSLYSYRAAAFERLLDDLDVDLPRFLQMAGYWERRGIPPPESFRLTRVHAHTRQHVPQQSGSTGDCGVMTCMFLEQLSWGKQVNCPEPTSTAAAEYRRRMIGVFYGHLGDGSRWRQRPADQAGEPDFVAVDP